MLKSQFYRARATCLCAHTTISGPLSLRHAACDIVRHSTDEGTGKLHVLCKIVGARVRTSNECWTSFFFDDGRLSDADCSPSRIEPRKYETTVLLQVAITRGLIDETHTE